ncbi:putative membrane spanning protein [Borrelia duttonii CR2A]|uniref:Putative membrane spanning protein n=1 Tax=Borrelia duttonii CR2A TaxID=1432657 RepID=W6TG60_9SPIR|nr:virulence associated lipoprotein [Borrelia duttonii]ETZ17892.1 putative membrane spanning protein [Borrelia duttonii CR2A]
MKQKVFIIFILISLISLLLIACGQNEKDPVDNAKVPGKSNKERREDLIIAPPATVQRKSEEEERQERIAAIKNATSVDVKAVLEKHNDPNWDDENKYSHRVFYFDYIHDVFSGVPHRVDDDGTEFLYNDATAGDRAKESKAARREVYLAFDYFYNFIWVFGGFARKLIGTSELVTKNKAKLKDLLKKMRDCAKAYYIDAHDTLQKKLGSLESLSGSDVKSLYDNLDKLETARLTLIADVVLPLRNKYSITGEYLANKNSIIPANITADDIETYWNTLSSKFNDDCNEIVRLGGEIKGILDNIKVKS